MGSGRDPKDLAARLTWVLVDQSASATSQQRQSVHRWQGRDRFYRLVQLAAIEDPDAPEDARDVADDLTMLAAPLTQSVQVWRGIRSIEATFGVPADRLHTLVGRSSDVDRFFSTTVDRHVAENEFTDPATDPGLYEITVQGGTEAVWLPPIGNPDEAHQGELLLLPGIETRIVAVDMSGPIPIVKVEVSDE